MRSPVFLAAALLGATACGGSTDVGATRYNFKVIRGLNQTAAAGSSKVGNPIVSKLTTAPDGQFASRSRWNFLRPRVAFAQEISVKGNPVVGGVVCAPIPKAGEPTPFSICTNTLADGTAPFAYTPGTKAGVYNIKFVAQTETSSLVTDSTTLIVEAGPADPNYRGSLGNPYLHSPAVIDSTAVQDQYGNAVAYRIVSDGRVTVIGTTLGQVDARTIVFDASLYDNVQDHVLELRGAGDALVGRLRYRISQGPDGQPQIFWTSAGVNVTP